MDPRVSKTRERVLAAATELFVDEGPNAVTVDAVVERSGVAKSTIYRHWDSRDDLLQAALVHNLPDTDVIDLDHGFEAALRSLVLEQSMVLAQPSWARLLPSVLYLRMVEPDVATLFDELHDRKCAQVDAILALGRAEGWPVEDLVADEVMLSLLGPLVFQVLTGTELDEGFGDRLVDRFIRGVRPKS